jgi:hypothetical protein
VNHKGTEPKVLSSYKLDKRKARLCFFSYFLGLLVIGSDTSLGRNKTNNSKFHLWRNYEQVKLGECLQELISNVFVFELPPKNIKFKIKCVFVFSVVYRSEAVSDM